MNNQLDQRKPQGHYHHGDLRKALIDAALDIVGTKGIDALTLRSVSKKLGVSHAAPIYHFPTKGDLLLAVAQEGFRIFADRLWMAYDGPAEGRMKRVGLAYLAFASENPNHYRVMFGPELSDLSKTTEGFLRESDRAFEVLAKISGEAGGAEGLGTRSLQIWSLVHGMIMLKLGPLKCRLPENSDAWYQNLMEEVLDQTFGHLS